jgi:hypothetical protein
MKITSPTFPIKWGRRRERGEVEKTFDPHSLLSLLLHLSCLIRDQQVEYSYDIKVVK